MCGHTPDISYIPSFIEIRSGILEPLGVEVGPLLCRIAVLGPST